MIDLASFWIALDSYCRFSGRTGQVALSEVAVVNRGSLLERAVVVWCPDWGQSGSAIAGEISNGIRIVLQSIDRVL